MAMDLWVERYRPKTLDEYVFKDKELREQVERWLKAGALPHLLLSGVQGSGKTSLAKLLLRQLKVQPGDVLEINASRERKIDDVIPKILTFCQTWALGDMKYVLLDEVDQFSPHAQRALRGEMEQFHDSVRFLLTCNYPNKIIPALHSRCQNVHFAALDLDEYMLRVANILSAEGVVLETEEDINILNEYVEKTHPDLRKCINMVQQNSVDGRLRPLRKDDGVVVGEYMTEVLNLFAAGRYTDARKVLVEAATPEEYDDIYRFMYQNLQLWGEAEAQQNEALLVIRKAIVNHGLTAMVDINLAACVIELANISK